MISNTGNILANHKMHKWSDWVSSLCKNKHQAFKEESIAIFHKLFQKTEEAKTLLSSLHEGSITWLPKPGTDMIRKQQQLQRQQQQQQL